VLCEYVSNFVASQCSLIVFWVCDGMNLFYWVKSAETSYIGWMVEVEVKELEASFFLFFNSNLNFAFLRL